MRVLVVCGVAAALGVAAAWGATQVELGKPESPLPAALREDDGSTNGVPRVALEGLDSLDFGTMELGSTGKHDFPVKNIGTAPLILTKGKTSCKCTISEVSGGPLAPGETRNVTLEWTPKGAQPHFEQSAEILTNDLKRPVVHLKVMGVVRDSLTVEPESILLNTFPATEPQSVAVMVWNFGKEPFEITKIETTNTETAPFFTVEPRPMTAEELQSAKEAHDGMALQITIKPGLPLGDLRQTIRLEHNLPNHKPVEIPVSGKAVGNISVVGADYVTDRDYVDLGSVVQGQAAKSSLFLVVKGEHREEAKLTVADVDPQTSLKAELGEGRVSGKSVLWPLTLTIPTDAAPVARVGSEQARLARITIKTGHPEMPDLVIRVRMTVTQ